MEKKYEIGGKTYIQRPLVLGQLKQMRGLLEGIEIPGWIGDPGGAGAAELLNLVQDHAPALLSIVLTPEGEDLRGKDLATLAGDLEFTATPETVLEVAEDFFHCNPLPSLLNRLGGLAQTIVQGAAGSDPQTQSTLSAS
jgi:hypothetical protein